MYRAEERGRERAREHERGERKVEHNVGDLIPLQELGDGQDGRRRSTARAATASSFELEENDENFPDNPLTFPNSETQPLGSVAVQKSLLRTPWFF